MPAPLTEEESREQAPPAEPSQELRTPSARAARAPAARARSSRTPSPASTTSRPVDGRPLLVHGHAHHPPPLRARRLRWPSIRVHASAPSSSRAARGSSRDPAPTLPRRHLRSARPRPPRAVPPRRAAGGDRDRVRGGLLLAVPGHPRLGDRLRDGPPRASSSSGSRRRPTTCATSSTAWARRPRSASSRSTPASGRSPNPKSSRRARSAGSSCSAGPIPAPARCSSSSASCWLRAASACDSRTGRSSAATSWPRWPSSSRRCATRSRRPGLDLRPDRHGGPRHDRRRATGWRLPQAPHARAARGRRLAWSTILGLEGAAAAELDDAHDVRARVRRPRPRPRPRHLRADPDREHRRQPGARGAPARARARARLPAAGRRPRHDARRPRARLRQPRRRGPVRRSSSSTRTARGHAPRRGRAEGRGGQPRARLVDRPGRRDTRART